MQSVAGRVAVRGLITAVLVTAVVVLGWIGWMWWESRLPGTYNVMDYGEADFGGVTAISHAHHGAPGQGVSVETLHGPREQRPDARFTLTARQATVQLASGRAVDALTFDGRSPGPELRVRQGDLVEVSLANEDVEPGVTIHWHGVDVPNAEDGVAGVTQDAVAPGERHAYRFRAEQVGTFWYHTHQASSKEVRRGLYGTLVIEPAEGTAYDLDRVVVAHTYDGIPTLDANDGVRRHDVEPGAELRLRLVNSDNTLRRFVLTGAPFRVLAIDGTELNAPEPIRDAAIEVAGGGRVDVGLTVPASPVWLSLGDTRAAFGVNVGGTALPPQPAELPVFDPAGYGRPAPTPFDARSAFDRSFELRISQKPGFFDGRPGMQWAINGRIFPDVPTFVVEEGDLVAVDVANETDADHPMHLHGHHLLVLSRDGVPVSGSPWWADTLNVQPGERYRVAFRAVNPGIWMDHCHNLRHAADGLTMHVAYAGVTTPFDVGGEHANRPE
jgi:FtsP/CotA-like multicopper oxidase with cupredoxin domain